MYVTTGNKKTSWLVSLAENGIAAVTNNVFTLKFIEQTDIGQLADSIKEICKVCHADGAVDVAFLIANADAHALPFQAFGRGDFQSDLVKDLPVVIRYVVADENGGLHAVSPEVLVYCAKYFGKSESLA